MLTAIKSFFDNKISTPSEDRSDHQLKLATAALLVEMMNQDSRVSPQEIDTVKVSLTEHFSLTVAESDTLFELAEKEAAEAVDYYQFTGLIAKDVPQSQKVKIIELLWSVAYADLHLDAIEDNMVRKIANLIHVPHKDLMQTKHKVQSKISGKA